MLQKKERQRPSEFRDSVCFQAMTFAIPDMEKAKLSDPMRLLTLVAAALFGLATAG